MMPWLLRRYDVVVGAFVVFRSCEAALHFR